MYQILNQVGPSLQIFEQLSSSFSSRNMFLHVVVASLCILVYLFVCGIINTAFCRSIPGSYDNTLAELECEIPMTV